MPADGTTTANRQILRPGDRVVKNDAGVITKFGDFELESDVESTRARLGVVIGVYAAGGTGKTTFFCSICNRELNPEGYDLPMLVLDAEAGIKSVVHLLGADLQRLELHTFGDLEKWINLARAQPKAQFPWRSIYLDNLSDLMNKALADQGFHNRANAGPGMTSSQPDYNAMTVRVTLALQDLRDLAMDYGFNVFISLWDNIEKTPDGAIIGYRADLTPKLSTRVQGLLDYIGYMSVLPSQVVVNGRSVWVRKLDFSPNPMLDSKWRVTPDRWGEVPEELYNPTLPAILNTIKRGEPFPKAQFARPRASHEQK